MSERLAFGSASGRVPGGLPGHATATLSADERTVPVRHVRERRDWAFLGLMAFTGVLYFRPQEQISLLMPLHLAELFSIVALCALIAGRLGRGKSVTRFTPELAGVLVLGALILATAPFSIWMGGAVATFTNVYVKVILIFVLMINTLNSPKRIDQFLWLIVVATGYIAFRAVFDYGRGLNLVENGRVQGAVGGMWRNPNDLALNMVAVIPLAASLAFRAATTLRRLFLAGCALLMAGAVVASQSRSGSVGLVVMTLMLGAYLLRRRPGLVIAGVLALTLAMPLVPVSYWSRISSITDATRDASGSRAARQILIGESYAAFLAHPLTGVGAGQFRNYDPEHRVEAWRETHNALLQVAAELGIFGLFAFVFLIIRAALAGVQTRRLIRRIRGGRRGAPSSSSRSAGAIVTDAESDWFRSHSAAMAAAMAGWFICSLFASVAYAWTFYYLLALAIAPREILLDRIAGNRPSRARVLAGAGAVHEARA